MPDNRQTASGRPMMSDAAIKAKTGRDWAEWFAALDRAGAAKCDHAGIATIAREDLGAGSWYGQMVAVSYERVRGIRAANQKCDGEFFGQRHQSGECALAAPVRGGDQGRLVSQRQL